MVTVTLDRERRLSYPWGSIKRLKREHGLNLLLLVSEQAEQLMEPDVLSAVLWAGLLADDPDLTVEQVDGMLSLGRLVTVAESVTAAIAESLKEGSQEANPPT